MSKKRIWGGIGGFILFLLVSDGIINDVLKDGINNLWCYKALIKPIGVWIGMFFSNPYVIGIIIGGIIVGTLWGISYKMSIKKSVQPGIRQILYDYEGITFVTSPSCRDISCICTKCVTPLKESGYMSFYCVTCDKNFRVNKTMEDIQLLIQGEFNRFKNKMEHKLKFIHYS